MSGLLSASPSPSVIRLTVGGFLLLFLQASIILIAPDAAPRLSALTRVILIIASACFAGALAGVPDPQPAKRTRHGR